jgi:hypothetical protein
MNFGEWNVCPLPSSARARVKDLARFLRVAISEQLHRALEAGEQHGGPETIRS